MSAPSYQMMVIDLSGNITLNSQGGAWIDWYGDQGENVQSRSWEFRTDVPKSSGFLTIIGVPVTLPNSPSPIPLENFGVRFTFEQSDVELLPSLDVLPALAAQFALVDITGAISTPAYPAIVRWAGTISRTGF